MYIDFSHVFCKFFSWIFNIATVHLIAGHRGSKAVQNRQDSEQFLLCKLQPTNLRQNEPQQNSTISGKTLRFLAGGGVSTEKFRADERCQGCVGGAFSAAFW